MKARTLVSGLVLLATLVAVGVLVESGLVGEVVSKEWIDRDVRGNGLTGELLFVGMAGVATALALPRQIVSFLGGYAFGFWLGTVLALAGTEVGCALAFFYARLVGRPLAGARLRGRVRRLEDFLAAHPFGMTLLVRLLPVGNNFLTCIAAGLSRVPPLPFLAGSLLGYVPLTMTFALAGSGVEVGATDRIALAAALLVASGLLGMWLYRRHGRGAGIGGEGDAVLEEPRLE